jgi:hypothetical protein
LLNGLNEPEKMYIYGMGPWKVLKWVWFWAEVAVKAWRNLATLLLMRNAEVGFLNVMNC